MTENPTQTDERKEVQRKAPDGGWGWVIVICAMVLNFMIGGAVNTFGVLYVELLALFHQSASKTAWVGSLANAMGLLLGPVSSALSAKFSCRKMVIVGGFLAASGWVLTGFMPKLEYMFLTYGLLAGIGKSLAYTPCIVVVGRWFDRRRSLANGLSVAGAGIGTFAFAPLLETLLQLYGFKYTMLIMGGVMLSISVCGAFFRDIPTTNLMNSQGENSVEGGDVLADSSTYTTSFKTISNSTTTTQNSLCDTMNTCATRSTIKTNTRLKDYLDYTLLKNRTFWCFGISMVLATLGHSPASVMLPPLAIQNDVIPKKAAFLLSITGIADIIGRLLFGALCDVKYFRRHRVYLYVASIFISGTANITCGFSNQYWHFATYAVIFGLFAGSYNALTPVILVDLLSADKLSSSFGLALLFQGIGFLLGPPTAGWLADGLGSYRSAFYFAGAAMVLSACFMNLTTLCRCCQRCRSYEINTNYFKERRPVYRDNRACFQDSHVFVTEKYLSKSGIKTLPYLPPVYNNKEIGSEYAKNSVTDISTLSCHL